MRRIPWVLVLVLAVAIVTPAATAQSTNRIAQYALQSGVRGYTCSVWGGMGSAERTAYIFGIISLSDSLEHAALDSSHSLTLADYRVIELTRSANDYVTIVSGGCLIVSGSTPVLSVLYTMK